ncbi:hypothetical protein BBJ28_00020462 [Nothophytophthora sp. Chile5]|nr:hypothetical protein BBJ28_00020462 [Nothophytophthora sp. Chile5]
MPSALPVLSMVANCVAWGLYGLLIGDYFPLVATNIVGVSLSLFYLVVYYRHASNQARLLLHILVTTLLLSLLVAYPVVADYAGEQPEEVHDLVGFVTVAISAVMFGSPLVLVHKVLQDRNTELLPLAMIVAGVVNCSLWLAYGLLIGDSFVVVPNAANLLLGVVQLALFGIFPRNKTYDTLAKAGSATPGSEQKTALDMEKMRTTDAETDEEIEKSTTEVETDDETTSSDEVTQLDEERRELEGLETTIEVR